jgi:predicted RNA binding protein YcfA (HicA-like mRNA interferase family)
VCHPRIERSLAALPKKSRVPRVPWKIRDLLKDLRKAGFTLAPGGKGSHRKFEHPAVKIPAIIPGRDGDDAKAYLERHIAETINESKS